jgi:resuscitation-promoting factor RpfB
MLQKTKPKRFSATQKPSRVQYFRNHPFVVPVVTFLILLFITLFALVAVGGQTIGPSDSKVVRLSIDGEEQIVPTRATTIAELLDRLEIELSEKDIVEPAIETEIEPVDFEINILKARTVIVVDDGKKTVIVTAKPDPRAIAKDAGLEVHPEDRIERSAADVPGPAEAIQDGLVAEKLVVSRAIPAHINLYGKAIAVRTHAETVGELLEEKNVKVNEEDKLQPSADTPIVRNIQIFVLRPGTEIVSEEVAIPMPVEIIDNPNLESGVTQVRQSGSPGRKVVTYLIEKQAGREVRRRAIQEVVAVEPIARIVVQGTRFIVSNPTENVRIGEQMAASRGWTGQQWQCLYQLWQRESGWRTNAGNPVTGAYGIPQAYPGHKMATHGDDWRVNPRVQISWGMSYISGRFGTPCAAWNFFLINNWY